MTDIDLAGNARNLNAAHEAPSGRRIFALALAVTLLISFVGVFDHSLWTPDEPRVAEVAREMSVSGDLVVTKLSQEPFLEQPPLHAWVVAGLYRLFGVSDGVARMASALAAVFTLLLVFDLLRRAANPSAALLGVVATATLSGFFLEYHRVVVDPWLSLFVMLGYWAFIAAIFPPGEGAEHRKKPVGWAIGLIYLAAGLSFLTKGPVGPGLIAGPIVIFVAATRRWSFLRSWMHLPGAVVFLGLCALWPWLLYRSGGTALMNGFLVDSLLVRFLPSANTAVRTGHRNPFWYYLVNFPAFIVPWLIAVPAVCHWFWRKRVPREWNRDALVFLAWVFPLGLLMLSVPGTKRTLYLLPLIAPFGAVVGAWLASVIGGERFAKIDRHTLLALAALLLAGSCLLILAAFCVLLLGSLGVAVAPQALGHNLALLAARIPRLNLVLFALVGAAICAISLRAVRLLKQGRPAAAILVAATVLGLMGAGMPLLYNSLDRFKNLHRFTADLSRIDAFSPRLLIYRPDEVTMGIVPFDTHHYLKAFEDSEKLERYLAQYPDSKLLVLERRLKRMSDSLRGRLRLLHSWTFSKHRTYKLYAIMPVAEDDTSK